MTPIRSARKSIRKRRLAQVSKGLTLGIVGALTFALPTSNNAQAQDQRPAAEPPHPANFLTWLEVADERLQPMRRISFRAERSGGADPVLYVIARRDGYSQGEVVATTWADGRTCPAIAQAMRRLADLPTPNPSVPGVPLTLPPEFPPQVRDGNTYVISTHGEMPDRHLTRMTLSSNGGPVADWGRFVERELEACWAPELAR